MVYKKFQVYDWFKTLDGAKRIDFLNGMLHLCFPLELRFLGSCIEELARKDFTFLREAELKANSVQEIHQMRDLCDKITRSKIIVTLALLSSSNLDCAQLLYDILNVDISDLLERMRDNNLDEKIADEFLLMLTMAANHPAFDFQMKSRMSQMYLLAEQKLKLNRVVLKESESEMFLIENDPPAALSSISNQSNNLLTTTKISDMESENRNHLTSQQISVSSRTAQDNTLVHVNNNNNCPVLELNVDTNNNMNNDELNETKKSMKPVFTTSSSTSSVISLDTKQSDQEKESSVSVDQQKQLSALASSLSLTKLNKSETIGEVESAGGADDDEPTLEASDFEGVKSINGTQIYKFIIRVKWSDNTSSEVEKTYSEFCEFNKQLTSLFPEELNGLIEGSQLVFRENQKEDFIKELPFVTEYCGKIATLPEIVRKSQFLRQFFRSKNLNTSVTEVKSPSAVVNPSVNEGNKLADKLASPIKASANSPRLTEESKTTASLKESKVSSSSLAKEQSEKTEPPVTSKPVTPSANTTPAHKVVVSVAEVMNNNNNHSNNSSKPPLNLDNNNNKNSIDQSNNILTDSTNIKSVHNSRFQAPQQQNSLNQTSANSSNNVAAASPPISISPSPLLTTTTGHQSTSNSVNNSRSNSPWSRNMPPPPVPAQSSQPLQMPLLPPSSMPNQYYYHHHQYAGMRQQPQQHQQQSNMFGKNNHKNGFAMSYGSYQNDEMMFPRHQINENFQSPIDDPQIDKYMKSNKNNMETRKGMNNSKGKSNGQHGKNNENSLIVETSMSSTNGPASPKMQQQQSHQNSNNMRSSSSCSSSYQTPPPAQQQQQQQQQSGGMNQMHHYGGGNQQQSASGNPLHLTSPSQHPTVPHSHYMHQILHNPHPHLVSLTSNVVPPPSVIPFPPPPNGSSSSSNLATNNGNTNNSNNGNKHAQNSSQSHLHHNMPVTLLAPLLHPMPIAMAGHQQTILPSQFIAPGASNSHLYKSQSQKQFYNSTNNSNGHQMNVNTFDGNPNNFSTTSDDEESTKGGSNSTTRAQQQQNTDEASDNNGGLNRNNNKMTGGRVQNIQRVQRKSISFNDSANSGKANSTFNSGPSSTPKVQSSGLLPSDNESNNSKSNQAEPAKKKDAGKDDKSEKESNGLMVNVNNSNELSTSAPVSAKSPPVMATPSNMPLHPHPPMIPNFGQANNLYIPPNTLMPQFLLEQYGLGLPANISILPAPNNGASGGNNNNTQQQNGQFNQFIAHMPPPNFNGPHLMPAGMHPPHPSHMHYMPNGSGSNSGNGANTNGTFLIPMMPPPPTHPIQTNSNTNGTGNTSSTTGTSSSTPGNSPNQGQSEKTQQQSDQQQQQNGSNNNSNGEQHSAMQPPHHLISPFNLHQMMLGPQNMGQQPGGPNGMNHGGNLVMMMMMGNGGQPGAPGSISFIQPPLHPSMHNGPPPVNSNLIPQQAQQQQPFYPPNQGNGAGKSSGPAAGMMTYPNHFQPPPYLIQPMSAPGTAHQQQSISPMSPPMSHSLSRNSKSSMNNNRKKSCYNCGSMSHAAHECKEPTIESSMPSQSSAQFKLNYQPPTETQTNANYSNSNGHGSATSANEPSATESTSESANKSTVSTTSSPKTVTNAINKPPISAPPLETAVKN